MINIVSEAEPNFQRGAVNVWAHVANTKPQLIGSIYNIKTNNPCVRRIPARKCTIVNLEASDARDFLSQCHVKGFASATYYLGLEYNGEIVMVMTFAPSRYSRNYTYEIIRLASTLNTVVVGGASKLLKYFIKLVGSDSIFTYSENMLGDGGVYHNLGFTKIGTTQPGYFWFKDGDVVSRHNTKKHNIQQKFKHLTDEEVNTNTEAALMCKMGYIKVKDLGNTIWGMSENIVDFEYHYLYRITRPSIDDCYYIGIHSTNDIDDGYLGSGIHISRSVKKYGADVHEKEILAYYPTRDAVLQAEASMVTTELLADAKCMNIICGGYEGFGRDTNKGKVAMKKPGANWYCFVDDGDIQQFIDAGFELGSTQPKSMGVFYTLPGEAKIRRSMTPPENHIQYVAKTTSGYKWVLRDGVRKLVNPNMINEMDILCPEMCSTVANTKQMVRGDERKFVPIEEIAKYEAEGFSVKGFTNPKLGKVEICKDGEQTIAVSEAEAIHKIKNEGWTLKRKQLKSAPPQVINVAKALGMHIPKNKLTDDYVNPPRKKQKSSSTGKISVRKDNVKRMVSIEDAKRMVLEDGWELGAASAWRLASDTAKQLGIELGYDVENNQKKLHQ